MFDNDTHPYTMLEDNHVFDKEVDHHDMISFAGMK